MFNKWFAARRPQVVFLAAAKVGGIVANDTLRAEFLYDNLVIATNVIDAAHVNGVEKLMFLGSSCIYPSWRRSRCARIPADRAAGDPPTSRMRSRRSPASRWSRPIAANMAPTSSA